MYMIQYILELYNTMNKNKYNIIIHRFFNPKPNLEQFEYSK